MIELTKDTFEEEIICSDKPVVLDFWGPQCAPCLALMPEIEQLEKKYGSQLKMTKVEAPKNRRFCLSLRVLSLPTYLFYKEGKEVNRLSGNDINIGMIEEAIKKSFNL